MIENKFFTYFKGIGRVSNMTHLPINGFLSFVIITMIIFIKKTREKLYV